MGKILLLSFEVMQYDIDKLKARKVSPNVFFKRPVYAGMNYIFIILMIFN